MNDDAKTGLSVRESERPLTIRSAAEEVERAWRLAELAADAEGGNKVAQKALSIMSGVALGLPPFVAVTSVAWIRKRPCLWGDAQLALVRAHPSGACEDVEERIVALPDGSLPLAEWPDDCVAVCTAQRVGKKPVVRSFSVADAKRAGLWGRVGDSGNPSAWVTYPQRMLQMRARSWALRDAFGDILCGLAQVEEMRDIPLADATVIDEPVIASAVKDDMLSREEAEIGVRTHVDPETGEIVSEAVAPKPQRARRAPAAQKATQKPEAASTQAAPPQPAAPETAQGAAPEAPAQAEPAEGMEDDETYRNRIIGALQANLTPSQLNVITVAQGMRLDDIGRHYKIARVKDWKPPAETSTEKLRRQMQEVLAQEEAKEEAKQPEPEPEPEEPPGEAPLLTSFKAAISEARSITELKAIGEKFKTAHEEVRKRGNKKLYADIYDAYKEVYAALPMEPAPEPEQPAAEPAVTDNYNPGWGDKLEARVAKATSAEVREIALRLWAQESYQGVSELYEGISEQRSKLPPQDRMILNVVFTESISRYAPP